MDSLRVIIGPYNRTDASTTVLLMFLKPGVFGIIGGIANPTGVALIVILTVIFFGSLKQVRRSGYFQVGHGELNIISVRRSGHFRVGHGELNISLVRRSGHFQVGHGELNLTLVRWSGYS